MSIESAGGVQGLPGFMPREPRKQPVEDGAHPRQVQTPAPGTSSPDTARDAGSPEGTMSATDGAGDLPETAPPGTDPDLWSVLTADERAYFARARAMGPVTYGQSKLGLAELGLHRGGRLDVRV